jgi:hypothetical protein
MKRMILAGLVYFALIGIANCVLIEPALACHKNVATCAKESAPICTMCNSVHHQWIGAQDVTAENDQMPVSLYRPAPPIVNIDPPVGSIFHPPAYL